MKKNSLGKMKIPNRISRNSKRKFARITTRFYAQIHSFLIGLLSATALCMLFFSQSAFAQSTNKNCGGTSQPRCEVNVANDQTMTDADAKARADTNAATSDLKGSLTSIPDDKFNWTFIPQIPTVSCVNPRLKSPIGTFTAEFNMCDAFNTFSHFMNGVLAVLCVFGCVRQVESAIKA